MRTSSGMVSNITRNLANLGHSTTCWTVFGTVMAVQTFVSLSGGVNASELLFQTLGLSREEFLAGKIWQIFSHGLLHGGWWHAGLNGLFLLLIGSRIEHIAGRTTTFCLILAGVLGGGLLHLLLGSGLLVGLSGGCMALLLFLSTTSPQSRMLPLPISGRNLGLGVMLAALVLALIDPSLNLPGFSSLGRILADHGMAAGFRIGHACHFGGGLAGWLFGRWVLRPRVTLDRLRRDRERREAA